MIEVMILVASLGITAIATFAWHREDHVLALILLLVAGYIGLQSFQSICGA